MYAHRGWVDKGSELESLTPLTPLAMSALQYTDMSDAVMELFTDVLNHFPAFLAANDFHTLSIFLTTDDARSVVAQLKAGDFDEDTMSFARLLLAYGDAAVQDLAMKPDNPQSNGVLLQLLELLKCDEAGGVEYDICSLALEFWMTYTEFAIDSLFDGGAEKEKVAWLGVARQRIEAVIEASWAKIQMPPPNVAATWDSEAKSNWNEFRKDVQDILQSSYTLLGVDLFGKLAQLALRSLDDRAWLPLEATLFCLNALSDSVADEESVDEILTRIFGSSLFVDMTNTEKPIPGKTRKTAVTMISNYTSYFERHPEHLPAMLNFLFASLRTPSLANVAAKAIFSACSSCRKTLTAELSAFMQQYDTLLTWDSTEINTKERVIGAVAAIIEALPTDEDKVAPLTQLIQSVESDATNCVRLMEVSQVEKSQESGLSALKCLASIGRALQAPDEAVIDLDAEGPKSNYWTYGQGAPLQAKIVAILTTITQLMNRHSDITEAGCQILRAGFKERTTGLFVFPIKVTVDFVLETGLDTARLDHILETAGVMLASHVNKTEEAMMMAASSFLSHILRLISAMNCKRDSSSKVEQEPLIQFR